MTPEQRARLPKYAQMELRRLEREVEHWKSEYEQMLGTSKGVESGKLGIERRGHVDGKYTERWVPFSRLETITFRLTESSRYQHRPNRVDMSVDSLGRLELYAYDGALIIQPASSNIARVGVLTHDDVARWT